MDSGCEFLGTGKRFELRYFEIRMKVFINFHVENI